MSESLCSLQINFIKKFFIFQEKKSTVTNFFLYDCLPLATGNSKGRFFIHLLGSYYVIDLVQSTVEETAASLGI